MRIRSLSVHACALALCLLAASQATAQVYLSDYLGTSGCTASSTNPPFTTVLAPSPWLIGKDTPGSFSCEPIAFRKRPVFLKGIGAHPWFSAPVVVEFDLDAIRQVQTQRLDVFEATVGINRTGLEGARFEVFLDGVLRASVEVAGIDADPRTIRLPVLQASTLRLETQRVGPLNGNHAAWGDAKLLASDSAILAWGDTNPNYGLTHAPALPSVVEIAGGLDHSLARRSDGSVVAWGYNQLGQANVPALPAGLTYVEIAGGTYHSLTRRSDGSVVGWGWNVAGQTNVPALPPGLTYVEVAAGDTHSLARRNDGSVVAWGDNQLGQTNVPALPAGLTYVEIAGGRYHSLARRSDGSVVAWGSNSSGQTNVPVLPAGLSYVEIACSGLNSLARRNDGSVVAWGDNLYGQTNVPALPAGLSYVEIAMGWRHSLARRSDGSVVVWGDNSFGQTDIPALPAGLTYVEIAAANGYHSLARRSDGSLVGWGANYYGQANVPAELQPTYTQVDGGQTHALALRSDGRITAWGNNFYGQNNVPALSTGMTYTAAAAGLQHSLAVRSDGQVLAWGANGANQLGVPALPAGVTYVDVAAGRFHSLARRSNGTVVGWGDNASGQTNVPTLAGGLTYVDIDADAGAYWSLGLVSDGSLRAWGLDSSGQVSLLPGGTGFVEIAAGISFGVARRADGSLVTWGDNSVGQTAAPALPAGLAYEQIASGWLHSLAVRSDGQLVAWGSNGLNQLNVTQAPSQTEFVEISAGSYNSYALRQTISARVESVGQGCGVTPASFYEQSPPGATNVRGFRLTYVGPPFGYAFSAGGSSTIDPVGAAAIPLALTDNSWVAPGNLGLTVSSNGLITHSPSSTGSPNPSLSSLLNGPLTLFALHDMDPTLGGGSVWYEQDIHGNATITFLGVYNAGGTSPAAANTVQFKIRVYYGSIDQASVTFGTTSTQGNGWLVGYSPAGPSVDPGSGFPSGVSVPENDTSTPLVLTAVGLPRVGTGSAPFQLTTHDIPPGTFFHLGVLGVSNPGIPLDVIGMPGCVSYSSLEVIRGPALLPPSNSPSTHTWTALTIMPTSLIGFEFYGQGEAWGVSANNAFGLGVIVSNGLKCTIGL